MSLQIASVKGIPIRLHFTLILVFFLVSWTLATSFMPEIFPDLSSIEYWTMGVSGAILLLVSVLLHELSHSIVAIKYGINVRQIVLFVFGGVSDIEGEPKTPRKELEMAFAGPATSFILSAIFALLWWAAATLLPGTPKVVEGVLFYGALLNALLGGFNLIPAFPLDGGRILRAALVKRNQDFDQSTRTAVRVGIGISYVFMGLGFLIMFTGSFLGGIWLLLIGWFLQSGAQSYLYQHDITAILSKVRLEEIMNTRVISIPYDIDLDEAVRSYFKTYMKSAFPVTDERNRLVGMVTLKSITAVPEDRRKDAVVQEIMTPAAKLAIMDSHRKADEALMQMARTGAGKVFVCDSEGRLVGLVSKTDILEAASERQELAKSLGEQKELSTEPKFNRSV
jgi:Zn-dependent protease/predicted transcriptional regulator